jgi:hypothetical protein
MSKPDTDRDLPSWDQLINRDGFHTFALTADIDWAPDYAVEDLLLAIEPTGFHITLFATHEQAILKNLPSWVSVGLHPDNTRPHPEHGLRRKILDLLDMYPEARGVRCHRNFFGQNIASFAAEAGLAYDASVFLWRHPHMQPWRDQYGLIRMQYGFEDGIIADMNLPWDVGFMDMDVPGQKIFNFHPIFTFLNCPNDDYRRAIVRDYKDLTQAPESAMRPHRHTGYGARNFLLDVLSTLSATRARSLTLLEASCTASAHWGAQ